MPITAEQWKQIESDLSMPYQRVRLKCDGHDVTALVTQIKAMRFAIAIYVDGEINFKRLWDKDEVAKKFYPLITRSLCKGKRRVAVSEFIKKRGIGKELKELLQKELDAKHSVLYPCWENGRSFCRHIRKTCTEIVLMEKM